MEPINWVLKTDMLGILEKFTKFLKIAKLYFFANKKNFKNCNAI